MIDFRAFEASGAWAAPRAFLLEAGLINQDDLDVWLSLTDGPVLVFNAARTDCLKSVLDLKPIAERVYIWWNTFTRTHSEGAFWQWQPIFVWRRSLVRGLDRDVIDMTANTGGGTQYHPTQKPVPLIEQLIEAATLRGGSVSELYLGSGTTFVACERLGRLGRGIEIAPEYVAVTLERLAEMGLEPRLAE